MVRLFVSEIPRDEDWGEECKLRYIERGEREKKYSYGSFVEH